MKKVDLEDFKEGPGSAGSQLSVVTQFRKIGTRYLTRFALVTIVIWGIVSLLAITQMLRERSRFFQALVEANQETIVSGQWRSLFEGLNRDRDSSFKRLELCWGEKSETQCGLLRHSSLLAWPIEVPLLNAGRPLVWVRAEVSILPAIQFSMIIFVAFLCTGMAGLALLARFKTDAAEAGNALSSSVSATVRFSDAAALQDLPEELRPMGEALAASLHRLQEAKANEAAINASAALAAQVAHDIRSPLASLESLLEDMGQLPERQRVMSRSAIRQIGDIANNLLQKNRESTRAGQADDAVAIYLLSSLIESQISQSRLRYKSKMGVDIGATLGASAYGLFAKVQASEFKRVLSNLINNAIEAIGDKGAVALRLTAEAQQLRLEVQDTGKGIPPEILAKLGQRGETHGKSGGSGLGLFAARTTAAAWGGTLELRSEVGKGTTAVLTLPKAQPPAWFVPVLELDPRQPVVILDDDTGIHTVWQKRFDSLPSAGPALDVHHFVNPSDCRDWVKVDASRGRNALYLSDYDLTAHNETGLDLIEELGLGERSILVTSRSEETQIIERCQRLKVRMIPKGLAKDVPIAHKPTSAAPAAASSQANGSPLPQTLDAVLIDDELLPREIWQGKAAKNGKKLRTFASREEFLSAAHDVDKDTAIYLDVNLGDGMRGDEFSKELHGLGFTNLILCTGYDADSFPPMPWVKEIRRKKCPWS